MKNIRIVNLGDFELNDGEVLIRVDLASNLGNPYEMRQENQRDDICDKYSKTFKQILAWSPEAKSYFDNIVETVKHKDVALGCWCYPLRCHAETIVEEVKKAIELQVLNK